MDNMENVIRNSNKENKNPFYGMKNCLNLFKMTGSEITFDLLSKAYKECKTLAQKQMFFSLLFSIGDITARQHNIFKGIKRDNGGNANREGFATVIQWMWKNHKEQFVRFLNKGLFEEYTCFDHLLRNRVKTIKGKVLSVYDIFANPEYRKVLVEHLYAVINGNNPFNKMLVAKFLTLPRLSKRKDHQKMRPETKKVMGYKIELLKELSKEMKWDYVIDHNIVNFKGYRAWRKLYNGNLESVLFSTGKILEFQKEEFIKWYEKLPALARMRVRVRIMGKLDENKDHKYDKKFRDWIKEWECNKLKKQEEQRRLEEKIRQGQATNEEKLDLERIKKEAKVNAGAINFNDLYNDICENRVDELALESFIGKVHLDYNSLVIIDDSGSMMGAPFNFACFIAAVCLVKNPDDDARNLIGFFNNDSHWHSYIDKKSSSVNSLWKRNISTCEKSPLVDPKKSFYQNYLRIKSFCHAEFKGGCTYIDSIPDGLHKTCEKNPEVLDALKSYPVWTIISDGEWNNLKSPKESINAFFKKCQKYFGFKPYIVAIDVSKWKFNCDNDFSGIKNFIYIPSNPAQIEQFLTNFKDMDEFDVYTPLQSLYRSNRYDLIRNNVI